MKLTRTDLRAAASALLLLSASSVVSAQEPTYKADVPGSLLTPNTVETELLGTLDFFDGMPSDETVRKTFDFLDTSRAAEAFLTGMPATSIYAMLEGMKQAGAMPGDLVLWENYGDARTLALTFNTSILAQRVVASSSAGTVAQGIREPYRKSKVLHLRVMPRPGPASAGLRNL